MGPSLRSVRTSRSKSPPPRPDADSFVAQHPRNPKQGLSVYRQYFGIVNSHYGRSSTRPHQHTTMTITDKIRENLKLASDTAAPYVDSAQKHASVAFAQVQEKMGHRGAGGSMHHSASSKDVTVRLRIPTSETLLKS